MEENKGRKCKARQTQEVKASTRNMNGHMREKKMTRSIKRNMRLATNNRTSDYKRIK